MNFKTLLTRICAAALLAPPLLGMGSAPPAPLQLRYVVIVTRHGVRSPTWPPERLAPYATEPWPDWGVPPGNLTQRGRALMVLLGTYYREWLTAEHVLSASGCEDAERVFVHADTDQRTLETGRALAESLLPGCGVAIHSAPEGTHDLLFNPAPVISAEPVLDAAARAVRQAVGSDTKQFAEKYRNAFVLLEKVLAGVGTPSKPIEPPAGVTVIAARRGMELSEPFALASSLSEDLLLEYTDGMRGRDLGWGRLDESTLLQILQLHTVYGELTRRTPELARLRGSNLLDHVRQSLEQAESGIAVPGAIGPPPTRVLIVVGHDTNILNLAGMLGLSWHLPGYPAEETPPGGALIFSLWQSAGHWSVRTEYLAQSLDQMRDASPLSLAAPPEKQDVRPSGCPQATQGADCAWATFMQSLRDAINPQFVAPLSPAP